MAIENAELRKPPPVMTMENLNPQVVAQDAMIAPTATKAEESGAINAGSLARELPNESKEKEEKSKSAGVEEKSMGQRMLEFLMTAMGLTDEEKAHTKVAAESKGAIGTMDMASVVKVEAEKVSGRGMDGIDPALLAAAAKGLRDSGAVIENTSNTPPQVQTASVAKQQETSATVG